MPERPANFDYQRYLASREWSLLKEQVRKRSNGTCERCHLADHQDTHHLTYERIGRESLNDLLGICRPCHEYLSGKSDFDPASEAIVQPLVYFSATKRGPADWVANIHLADSPEFEPYKYEILDPKVDLVFLVIATMQPESRWHPMAIAGSVKDAMDCEFAHERREGEGRPLYARRLSTLFFRCSENDSCELCHPTGPY